MSLGTVLLIVLILLLVGALPSVGIAPASWGWGATGILGVVVLVLVILLVTGRL